MVAVSENGTEAAVVTVIEMVTTSAFAEFSLPPHITFNRPFLIMIFDKTTNSILFVGKIVNPAAIED